MATLLVDDRDLSDQYNTKLSDEEEKQFQAWAEENKRTNDTYDYDMRGAWKEMQDGSVEQDDRGHFPDTYKKPNHPTFSDQSKYHGTDGKLGGKWSEDSEGHTVFTPSETNLKNMTAKELRDYFSKIEPDAILNIPDSIAEKLYPTQGK